ncbi:MAG: hypothetical protein HN368_22065 [Spirochaetales bacterium]|jgi:hypothetical protein|nr:hypothetical protein [Spirochaetales bacterium]
MIEIQLNKIQSVKRFAILLSAFGLGLAALLFLAFSPFFSAEISIWNGYYILLADAEAELDPILDSLDRSGITHVSSRTTMVSFSTFSGQEQIALSRLESRLEPADPRYDRYMANLHKYFTGVYRADSWHIIYLPTSRTALGYQGILKRTLDPLGIEYRTPEISGFRRTMSPVIFCIYILLVVMHFRRRKLILTFAAIPLLLLAARGSAPGFAAAAAMLPAWVILVNFILNRAIRCMHLSETERDFREFISPLLLFLCAAALSFCLTFFHTDPVRFLTLLLGSFFALFTTLLFFCLLVLRGAGDSEHPLFYPLTVLKSSMWKSPASVRNALRYCLLLLIVLPAVFFSFDRMTHEQIPKPIGAGERIGFSFEAIRTLENQALEDALPDIAGYITHRAYQDGMLYGRSWRFPDGIPVTIRTYSEADGESLSADLPLLEHDEQWFESRLNEAGSRGIPALLLAQRGPVSVVRSGKILSIAAIILRQIALAIFLVSPVLLLPVNLTSQYFYGMRNLLLRRKRQTA